SSCAEATRALVKATTTARVAILLTSPTISGSVEVLHAPHAAVRKRGETAGDLRPLLARHVRVVPLGRRLFPHQLQALFDRGLGRARIAGTFVLGLLSALGKRAVRGVRRAVALRFAVGAGLDL